MTTPGPLRAPGVWVLQRVADDTRKGFQCPCSTGRRIAIYRKVELIDRRKTSRLPALRGVRSGGQAGVARVTKRFQFAPRFAH